jgi:hypothetical protein
MAVAVDSGILPPFSHSVAYKQRTNKRDIGSGKYLLLCGVVIGAPINDRQTKKE